MDSNMLHNEHDAQTTDSQDKGSLNAFRTLLNYGALFNEEKLMDDTYRHARPYNLVIMSTRSLWIVYLFFYAVIIGSTVFSFKEGIFINDIKIIETPTFTLLNDNASLISHGYDPLNEILNDYNGVNINKSIANVYFHNDSFYPYQEYIYLSAHFTLNEETNLSDPFIYSLLHGIYAFNYTVLLNVTNNDNVLGFEWKYMENAHFLCSIDICPSLNVWSPYDTGFSASWQNNILYEYKSKPDARMLFNTTIIFYSFNLNKYGNFSLSYVYGKEDWVHFEFYTKCLFAVITLICLILWIMYGLRDSKTQKDLIAEQRWMIVLFFALLLYQDPLTIGLFTSDSFDAIYLISSLFFATSINLFMIYWSLMIDSIREIKNLIDVGVTFGCTFYRGKLIAICISYSSALVFTIFSQYLIENNTENKSYNGYFYGDSDSLFVIIVIITGIIWVLCVLCFVIWLFSSLWNANKELNKLPYIETRERQLSLRYFKHHTFCVIIYIVIMQIYSVYRHESPLVLVDNRRTNISTLIVVSVYVYLVAFMYLPMTNKKIKMAQHDFQVSNAILLCHMAWQSYLSPQNNNIKHFKLQLIQFVTNKEHDVQIVVTKGKIHKLFKQERKRRKTYRKHRKHLLLAPHTTHTHIYQYKQKVLEDVSSDESSSSISSENKSSLLSFDAIKTLFTAHRNDRSQTVFNKKYGAIQEDDNNEMIDGKPQLKNALTYEAPLLHNTRYQVNEYPQITIQKNHPYHAPNCFDGDIESVVTVIDDPQRTNRSQTVQNKNSECQEEEKYVKKKRASTLSTHNRFKIPLLSNLIPNRKRKEKYVDIVIAFRGTDSNVNVKLDLKFRRITIDPSFWYEMALNDVLINRKEWNECVRRCIVERNIYDNPLNIPPMKIHSGFYQSFKDIRIELIDTVLTTYYSIIKKNKIARFYVTGHSLGGALAQLFALCLEMLFGHKSLINVYVYGCPRVGNQVFSDFLGQRVKHLYRVVFRGDIVTTIPRAFGYYKHSGHEIIIDAHGNMINNPSKREKALLPSRTSLKDHSLTNYIDSLNIIAKKHKLTHLMLTIPE